MKYVKLGVAIFAIFVLTAGVALLTTGGIIASSSNTKSAELNYRLFVYNQSIKQADKDYDAEVKSANDTYKAVMEGLGSKPIVAGELAEWDTKKTAAENELALALDGAKTTRDDEKYDALEEYNLAVLNVKRNLNDGQDFSGSYRVANTLTTIETKVHYNSEGYFTETFETVLSPAGKLLVMGMILTLVGLGFGVPLLLLNAGVIGGKKKIKPTAEAVKPTAVAEKKAVGTETVKGTKPEVAVVKADEPKPEIIKADEPKAETVKVAEAKEEVKAEKEATAEVKAEIKQETVAETGETVKQEVTADETAEEITEEPTEKTPNETPTADAE